MKYIDSMTAIAEIESAIERLSPAEVKELAAWFEEYQQMINASAEICTTVGNRAYCIEGL